MSKHYEEVKDFYNSKLWSERMVQDAVSRWITADEYQTITGTKYKNKKN